MVYNLTGLVSNSTTYLGFIQGVNEQLMLGWFGTLFLIGIVILVFMAFIGTTGNVKISIMTTSVIAMVLALLLTAMDLITNNVVLYATLVLCAAAIAFGSRLE